MFNDYKIKDISLAPQGKVMCDIALSDMPALKYAVETGKWILDDSPKPLKGRRIALCIHHTAETNCLVRALVALGAEVRCSSCNIFSTQDIVAAWTASLGIPVFAWHGESEEEYWQCIKNTIFDDGKPFQLLDDGFDMTAWIHSERPDLLASGLVAFSSEETSTGIHRAKEMEKSGTLKIPVYNVNDAITKQGFDNQYGTGESTIWAIKNALDIQMSGKTAVVIGYGQVGRGVANALRGHNCNVYVTEIDPICALQAAQAGFRVHKLADVVGRADIIATTTGNIDVLPPAELQKVKHNAVILNVGHFDGEISTSWLRENAKWELIKPELHKISIKGANTSFYLLAEGRLANLGCGRGHSSFVMSTSFTIQILAQILGSTTCGPETKPRVIKIPKLQDEHNALIHLRHIGFDVDVMTAKQSQYINKPITGPFKDDDYKY